MYKDRINIILESLDIIDDNLDYDINTIKYQIEDNLGYTYSYISELYKGELGITTHEYIMSRKGINIKNNVNQIKSKLQNRLKAIELLDSKIIKQKSVKGEEIFIKIDDNELFILMIEFPILVFPKNEFIDQLLCQIDYEDTKATIVPLYIIFLGFILQQAEIKFCQSEIEYFVNISNGYEYKNPTIYYGLYIFTPFNRLMLEYSNSKKRILNNKEIFSRIATVFNLKVFNNNIPESIVKNESQLRLASIFIITKQYYENIYGSLHEIVLFISSNYSYKTHDIYEVLLNLINEGIIVFITKIQEKYFYDKQIDNG